ncbi:FAD-binding oxidoreductase [Sphingomonas sp.]|jgi:D-arginine dehydrogenase|uniref:NAD(P)/FAD-dependent oxidoreductase n=1 Tax=Sphingomonas sp. TaxID=28214 RepID=UPI002DE80B25|nr:FAD-binding oxidoreductase [Sphingomonas sp.]
MLAAPLVVDVAVIGGGMVGTAVAAEIAGHSSVVLLEAEASLGAHTTGRSAAVFVSNYGAGPVRVLTEASRAFLESPPVGFSEAPLLRQRGCLFIARDDRKGALLAQSGEPGVRAIAPSEALELVPVLRRKAVAFALYEETARDIDVDAVQQGYLRLLRERGGSVILGCRVEALERSEAVWRIAAGGRRIIAGKVVNAAGAWADELAGMAGARPIGLSALRRTAALVPAPAGIDVSGWPFVVDVDETIYFKPDAGHVLLSPADETPSEPCDAHPEEIDVATAVYRYEEITTETVRRVIHKWAGLRVFAPDRLPVIGPDPELMDFHWCACLGGFGIQTAPAVAALAASLIHREACPEPLRGLGFDAASVSPSRLVPGHQPVSGAEAPPGVMSAAS